MFKKVTVILLSSTLLLCLSITKSSAKENSVLLKAYNNNLSNISSIDLHPEYCQVVYDSRYDQNPKIPRRARPTSYSYFKTYRANIICKGTSYPVNSYALNASIDFYVNVYFKLDKSNKSHCNGYDKPVITSCSGSYGATGYSHPSVSVSSYTDTYMNFKGKCILTVAGIDYTMSGTKKMSL